MIHHPSRQGTYDRRDTKVVLTVIALGLVALVFRPYVEPGASYAIGDVCGSREVPCAVWGSVNAENHERLLLVRIVP